MTVGGRTPLTRMSSESRRKNPATVQEERQMLEIHLFQNFNLRKECVYFLLEDPVIRKLLFGVK
jgi:hypothetical protein